MDYSEIRFKFKDLLEKRKDLNYANDPDVLALKYLEGVDNITLCLDTLDEFADDAFDRQNLIFYFL